MPVAADIIARAQALLDPSGQGLFSDARLMPYVGLAYASARDEAGATAMLDMLEAVTVLPNVAAGTNDLGAFVHGGASGGLLAGLAVPIAIYEKPAGTDDSNYTPVRRVEELPHRLPDQFLIEFEWRGGNVHCVGATQNLDLQVRYEKEPALLKTPQDPLPLRGLANALGYWTAGLMATAMREGTLGAGYLAEGKRLFYLWRNQQMLEAQEESLQPEPFQGRGQGQWPTGMAL